MTREEVKKIRAEKKAKKALKYRRGRHLRNFIIWLVGFLSSFIVVAAAAFICVGVVPIGNYFGKDTEKYVSAEISQKTLLQAIGEVQNYKVADLPVLTNALESLITEHKLDNYVDIDMDKLKDVHFVYSDGKKTFSSELQTCIKVTASIKSLNLLSMFGKFGELQPFKQWTPLPEGTTINVETDFNGNNKYNLYYYLPSTVEGEPTDKDYTPAFTLIQGGENDGKVQWVNEEAKTAQLYYVNLAVIPITDALPALSNSISVLKVYDVLNSLSNTEIDKDGLIYEVIGDHTVGQMGELSVDDVKITKVLGEPNADNQSTYDVLMELAGVKTVDELTIKTLTKNGMNIGTVKLGSVLASGETDENLFSGKNEKLYKILNEAVNVAGYNEDKEYNEGDEGYAKSVAHMKIDDLSAYLNIGNITLKTAIGDNYEKGANTILDALLDDQTATVGNLSAKINDLSLKKFFPGKCFEEKVVDPSEIGNYDNLYLKHATEDKYLLYSYVMAEATSQGAIGDFEHAFWDNYEFDNGQLKTYTVNQTGGAWFFMFYTMDEDIGVDQEPVSKDITLPSGTKTITGYKGSGLVKCYVAKKDVTFGEMSESFKDVTGEIAHATVRELLDLGLLRKTDGSNTIDYSKIKAFTIEQAIRFGNDLMGSLGINWDA